MTQEDILAAAALAALAASIAVARRGGGADGQGHGGRRHPAHPGSPFADRIALRLSRTDPNQLQVDVGDDGSADDTFDLSTFGAIDVEAGNGNDTVRIDTANGAFTTTEPTPVDGGNGDDTLIGGSGNECSSAVAATTSSTATAAPTRRSSAGRRHLHLGSGRRLRRRRRRAASTPWSSTGPGGNEIMAATANGGRVSFTRNLGGIVMDLNDVEAIDVNALGGTDSVTVNDLDRDGSTARQRRPRRGARRLDRRRRGRHGHRSTGTDGDDTIAATANGGAVDVSGLAASVRIAHADPALDRSSSTPSPATTTSRSTRQRQGADPGHGPVGDRTARDGWGPSSAPTHPSPEPHAMSIDNTHHEPRPASNAGSRSPPARSRWRSSCSSSPGRRRPQPRSTVRAAVVNGTLVVSGTRSRDRIALRLSRDAPEPPRGRHGRQRVGRPRVQPPVFHGHQRRGRRRPRPDADRHRQGRLHEREADADPGPGRR